MFPTTLPVRAVLASPAFVVLALTATALIAAVYATVITGDIAPALEAGRSRP